MGSACPRSMAADMACATCTTGRACWTAASTCRMLCRKAPWSRSKSPGMNKMAKIRVLLVDDHDIVRLGLMTLINDRSDMEVVGEAGDAGQAVDQVQQLEPDVVLMDVRLP